MTYKDLNKKMSYYERKQKESEEMIIALLWLGKWTLIATALICIGKVIL